MVKIMKIKLDFNPRSFLERSLREILSSPQNVIIPYATGLKILRVLHKNDNLTNELIQRYKEKQLENGGVPDEENKVSIMETIFFIDSLLRHGYDLQESSIQRACSFLLNAQRRDGGFPSYVNEKSQVHLTAWALSVLYRTGFLPTQVKEKAVGFLKRTRNLEGGWDGGRSPEHLAMIVLCDGIGLCDIPTLRSSEIVKTALNLVISYQNPDGSWRNDAHLTHLGLGVLVAFGYSLRDDKTRRALEWLARHQNEDGSWGFIEKRHQRYNPWITATVLDLFQKLNVRWKL
jgi:prenyltransferase beta subunit